MRDSVVHGIDLVDPLDLHQLVMDRLSPRAARGEGGAQEKDPSFFCRPRCSGHTELPTQKQPPESKATGCSKRRNAPSEIESISRSRSLVGTSSSRASATADLGIGLIPTSLGVETVRAARKLDQYAAQKVDHLRAFILCGSDRATVNLIPPSASSRQREPAWAGERPPRTAELHASM